MRAQRAVNFSSAICEPLAAELRMLPVPDVGWSDWGSVERICTSLEQMGKLDECLARLRHRQDDAALALPLLKQRGTGMRLGLKLPYASEQRGFLSTLLAQVEEVRT